MSVRKQDTLCRQMINVGRSSLGVFRQAAHPIVQIIDGDEQDIWLGLLFQILGEDGLNRNGHKRA